MQDFRFPEQSSVNEDTSLLGHDAVLVSAVTIYRLTRHHTPEHLNLNLKISATDNLQNSNHIGGHISTSQAQKLCLVHISSVAKIAYLLQ